MSTRRSRTGLETLFLVVLMLALVGEARAVFFDAPDPAVEDDKQAHPQIVFLDNGGGGCTATIIASDRVLTSAHCVANVTASNLSVFLDHNANTQLRAALWEYVHGIGPPTDVAILEWSVAAIHVLPEFLTTPGPASDLAILEMDLPIPPSLIPPLPVVPMGLLPAPSLPGTSGLDRWQGFFVWVGGGGQTSSNCLAGAPSPIHRFETDVLDVDTGVAGLARLRVGSGTGFSTSHLCDGDSGAPIVTAEPDDYVGEFNIPEGLLLSVLFGGLGNTEAGPMLQDPTVRQWLTTHGLDVDGDGIEAADDLCDLVYDPQQSPFDTDGDGWTDTCDPDDDNDGIADLDDVCPKVEDPDQTNTDGDAWGDLCDSDDDNDQVLDDDDNCGTVANPDQANCNAVAELAAGWSSDGVVLGDACDPAPCADPSLHTEQFVAHTIVGPYPVGGEAVCTDSYGREIAPDLRLRELIASAKPSVVSQDLEVRFCYCPVSDLEVCAQAPYHCRLELGDLDLPEATSASDPPASTTRWLRIAIDTATAPPVPLSQPLAATFQPVPAPWTYYRWGFQQDFAQWVTVDQLFSPTAADPSLYGPGTDLVGLLWTHDPSSVGWDAHSESVFCPQPGGGPCSIADSFEVDVAPDRALMATSCNQLPQPSPAPWWTYCPQCFDGFSNPYDEVTLPLPFVSLIPETGQAVQWLAENSRPDGWPAGAARDVSTWVSAPLIDALTDGSSRWVAASEPLSVAGRVGAPRALALASDGSALTGTLATGPAGFDFAPMAGQRAGLGRDGQTALEPRTDFEARTGFAAAYSLDHGTLFVLGGTTSRGALADSWSQRLGEDPRLPEDPRPLEIDPDDTPRDAESAVFSVDDGAVWVVDRVDETRWLRWIDPWSGASDSAWRPELDDADRVWLVALEDGRVVAAVARGETWELLGLEWVGDDEVAVVGSLRGDGELVAAPGVRAGKISLALAEHGQDPGHDTVGLRPIAVDTAPLFAHPGADPRAVAHNAALDRLRAVSEKPVETRLVGGWPRFLSGRFPIAPGVSEVEGARRFLERYRDFFGHRDLLGHRDLFGPEGSGLELHLRGVDGGRVGFYQTWNGIPVIGGEVVVFLADGAIQAVVGALVPATSFGPEALSPMPAVPPGEARELAALALGDLGIVTEPNPTVAERLTVFDPALFDEGATSAPRLAWHLAMASHQVLVDGHSGALLAASPLDSQALTLEIRDAGQADPGCGFGFEGFPLMGDEAGLVGAYTNDATATAILNGIADTHQFYLDELGFDSVDGAGMPIESLGHYDFNGGHNGQWQVACHRVVFSSQFAAEDTTAHEVTHGVIYFGMFGGPNTASEQGNAINEHLADVMAMMVDSDDWTFAEHLPGGPARDFANPAHAHMSNYDSATWPHERAGIPNRAAYVLTVGDGPFQVEPQGRDKVTRLYFDSLRVAPQNVMFGSLPDLLAAQASNYAAVWPDAASYGWNDDDVCSIRRAFLSVGIGTGCAGDANPQDDGDGVPSSIDNCLLQYNPLQADCDQDGLGDLCDPDDDNDGLADPWDPCRCNPDPWCSFFPGPADDLDDDGIANSIDNCPGTWNPSQANMDPQVEGSYPEGDACDPDLDGDLLSDNDDNCLWIPNADQANADGDLVGDVCDACPNDYQGDIALSHWNDPVIGDVFQVITADGDADGIPDACDDDGIAALDGSPPARGANELRVDGFDHSLFLQSGFGDQVQIPLAGCEPECSEATLAQGWRIELEGDVHGLAGRILDDRGFSQGALEDLGRDRLGRTFRPAGGRHYSLHLELRGLGGSDVEITARLVSEPDEH